MRQIRYFIVLCETLNFSRAAEQCHVTQPSLTRAIQALEAEFGGELIRRERSLSHLTDLGERMLPLLRQCYETAVAAKELANSVRRGDTAPLSVAMSRTVNVALFAPYLRELSQAFPGLQLTLHRGSGSEVCELLKSGEVELGIAGPLDEAWARLDTFPLFVEPFELIVGPGHRLSGREAADFSDLLTERILLDADNEMADELAHTLSAAGIQNTVAHQAVTESDLIALLEADLGITILPASAARSEHLCHVALSGCDLMRSVAVYGVAGRRRAAAGTTLLNLLRTAEWPAYPPSAQMLGAA
jgi:DNA-binding transcriptional LysR family regulator